MNCILSLESQPSSKGRGRHQDLLDRYGSLTTEKLDPKDTDVLLTVASDAIPAWLDTPNQAFDGLKPLEVIERGENDRLWNMIFYLESGVAS